MEEEKVGWEPEPSVIKLLFNGSSFHLQSERQTQSPHVEETEDFPL